MVSGDFLYCKCVFVLAGNVVNGTIGKQMVDMLVESSNNVEMILKFFDMFLKLKDLTSSDAFKEYDPDGKGKTLKIYLIIFSGFTSFQFIIWF